MDRRPLSADPLHQARAIVFGVLASSLIVRTRVDTPVRKVRQTEMLIHIALGAWIGLALCAATWLITQ